MLAEGFEAIARGRYDTLPARAAFIRLGQFFNRFDAVTAKR